jgi:hypothetical protein
MVGRNSATPSRNRSSRAMRTPLVLIIILGMPLALAARTMSSVGKADRAIQIAASIYLNEGQTGMLFMLGAPAAVQGTPLLYLGAELDRHGARFVKGRRPYIHLGVGAD